MEGDIKSYTAGGEISPCRFVKAGAVDYQVIQATDGSSAQLGISEQVVGVATNNVAASGDTIDVVKADIAYLQLGDTVTRGQYLTSDANGCGIPAVIVAGTPIYCGAIAEISGVVGDIIPAWINPVVIANDTGVVTANLTITSAQLLALHGTPQPLVAAPGAGKALILVDAQFDMPYNSIGYTVGGSSDLEIRYTNGSGQLAATIETTGFLDQTSEQFRFAYPASAAAIAPVANAALVLDIASAEVTAGNSTLKVRVRYRTITLAL